MWLSFLPRGPRCKNLLALRSSSFREVTDNQAPCVRRSSSTWARRARRSGTRAGSCSASSTVHAFRNQLSRHGQGFLVKEKCSVAVRSRRHSRTGSRMTLEYLCVPPVFSDAEEKSNGEALRKLLKIASVRKEEQAWRRSCGGEM